ncbi:DMT family transporter, partial [Azospirillum brasilense]|uniref:DMT family transporter n=1 Tax=Azospirillum brasilense TaxID=192 RepID=UPI001FFF4150
MSIALSAASYLLVVGAGVSVALQQVLNANLRADLGSPWWAGFVSYVVGMLAMLAVGPPAPGPPPAGAGGGGGGGGTRAGGRGRGAVYRAGHPRGGRPG